MGDTIQSLSSKSPTSVPDWHVEKEKATSEGLKPTKMKEEHDAKKAPPTSLYYMTTLSSLATDTEDKQIIEEEIEQSAPENKLVDKSYFDRARDWFWDTKDWLWNIVGLGKSEPVSATRGLKNLEDTESINATDNSVSTKKTIRAQDSAGGVPQLERPDAEQNERLDKSIRALRQELLKQKEITESVEDYNSSQLDKIIFLRLVDASIKQKKLKESSSIQSQEDLLHLHKKNGKLRKAHHELVDAIIAQNKTREVLKWVNVGLSIVTVGGAAVAFAVGGPLGPLAVALPLSIIGKGTTTIFDGILKYTNDTRTGELVPIKSESQLITSNKKEKMKHIQVTNDDIAELYKMLRNILDMQSKHERANFGG